ncbi:MAG: FAD binding domain-containing protein [Acidimicrobiales bacterium]
MPSVLAYHRPGTLEEASTLLAGLNRRALGGGTVAVPEARVLTDDGVELVDLQALGLDSIDVSAEAARLGAMVRVGAIAADDRMPELCRDLARRELPSALRNQATVGGTVALADPDSVLLAGLLVCEASVELHGKPPVSLGNLLMSGIGDGLITHVQIQTGGVGLTAATGRTPADVPIVSATARRALNGDVSLALTGVASTPVLADPDDPTSGLEPTADFRGSSDYRLHLVEVLVGRVLDGLAS